MSSLLFRFVTNDNWTKVQPSESLWNTFLEALTPLLVSFLLQNFIALVLNLVWFFVGSLAGSKQVADHESCKCHSDVLIDPHPHGVHGLSRRTPQEACGTSHEAHRAGRAQGSSACQCHCDVIIGSFPSWLYFRATDAFIAPTQTPKGYPREDVI